MCTILICVMISVCECAHSKDPVFLRTGEFFTTQNCISGPPRFPSCYALIRWFIYASIKSQLGGIRQAGISATARGVILRFGDLKLLAFNTKQPQHQSSASYVFLDEAAYFVHKKIWKRRKSTKSVPIFRLFRFYSCNLIDLHCIQLLKR